MTTNACPAPPEAVRPALRELQPADRPDLPTRVFYLNGDRGEDARLLYAHRGTSMNPTLCAQDFLEVAPYGDRRVRAGDVIAFAPPEGDTLVAHRVIGFRDRLIRTRGDNNSGEDRWALTSEDVIGQIVGAWRGNRRRPVASGPAGRWVARGVRLRRRLLGALAPLLHLPYELLARSGLVRRLWPARWAPRVVVFQVAGQSSPRLLLGRRTIGWYDARRRQWRIRRPYRLIVDVGHLPGSQATHPPHPSC